jgi:ribosomal protein L3 glutamine methyltransferase
MDPSMAGPGTVGDLILRCARALEAAGVWFGHGTDNAVDEAAALVLFAAGLPPDTHDAYDRPLEAAVRERIADLLDKRIGRRLPLPYITGEAWFAGLRFRVDPRVLIPRSPIAELIEARFEPWIGPAASPRILEIGTGSGCIAIAMALAFPGSVVTATDLSTDALAVALENRRLHGVEDRVMLVCADLLRGLKGPFDLVVSNPPYVPEREAAALPAEYLHEPRLALASGRDGLETPRRILQDAARCLAPGGWLVLEVGAGWEALEAAFPRLPVWWPEFERGGEGVALIAAADLAESLA